MGEAQLEAIQGLADGNPSWSRRQLADALVQGWVWRNAVRRLKDMSCRLMLARLEAKGLVRLPARSRLSPKLKAKVIAAVSGGGILARVGHLSGGGPPVSLEQVGYGTATTALFYHLLARYHYLGYPYPVGAKVRYLARGLSGLRRL